MIGTRLLMRFLISSCILVATSCQAATINPVNCLQPVVQAAISLAAVGDTVNIPAGNCTWTSPVAITKGMILQGAGQDVTVISGSGSDFLLIKGNGGHFRLTGMGFTGNNGFGAIQIDGQFASLHIDHLKFTNLSGEAIVVGFNTWYQAALPAISGLLDHITYTNNACHPFIKQFGATPSAWTTADNWGTNQALYLEDSTVTYNMANPGNSDCDAMDMEAGARAVVRHNTFTNAALLPHDTGSTGQLRGMRIREIYSNTWVCSGVSDCGNSAMNFRGGSAIVFDNTIPICQGACTSTPTGWENATFTQIQRLTFVGGGPWTTQCQGPEANVCSDFRSHCSGGTHPACGAQENPGQACDAFSTCGGAPCGICQNTPSVDADCGAGNTVLPYIDGTSTAGGYVCRDQTGRGIDSADHLSQALTPVYWWNNTDSNTGAQITTIHVATNEVNFIQANREYYTFTPTFNGTSGVGRGLLSARPASCTPMVGYYATDTATLYQCTATNAWTRYYSAFPYPHPFQAPGFPPPPPSGLRVVVH